MSQKPLFCSLALLTLALTASCVNQPKISKKSHEPLMKAPAISQQQPPLPPLPPESMTIPNPPTPTVPASIPIEPETLYDLLIAEMSGKVNRLEIALGNYMRQAHLTKDPAVIERYARIASYMQAHQATLDATKLWISTDPTNVDALHLMLNHQIEQGNGKRQEAALKALLTQTTQLNLLTIEQQLNNAPAHQRIQFHNVISRLFADTTSDFKRNDQLWYLKAKTNSLNGHHEAVIKDIKALQKINNEFLPAYVLIVDAYEKTDQLKNAEKSLAKLIKINPNNKKIRIYHTRLLIQMENFEAAHDEFQELLQLFPDDLNLKLTAGVLAAQINKLTQALSLFETLIEAHHRTNEVHIQIALAHKAQENQAKAIKHFLLVTPSAFYQEARFNAAQLLAQQDNMAQAIRVLEEAAQAQPTFKHVYTIAATELFLEYNQPQKGFSYLNKAIVKNPKEPSLVYSRAILYIEQDNFEASEADLRSVLKMKPDNIAALNALGYTLADRNIRLEEAQILLDKANALSPNDPPILDSLGWLEYRLGNHQQAKKYLSEAFALLQDHEIAAHLGEVLWVMGQQKEALKIWKKALELHPDSPIIKKTMKRFKQ